MRVLQFPNRMLLTSCEEVVDFDKETAEILDDMWQAMKENNGLGLAANQIGVLLDMFVIDGPNGRINMVNPYIAASAEHTLANMEESCLSAPGEYVLVPGRKAWVQVVYQNEKGAKLSVILKDIHAVCAQHEIEHLDGNAFFQHKSIPKTTRKKLSKKWGLK